MNLGLFGYPMGVEPVDAVNTFVLGIKYREPSYRSGWVATDIGATVASSTEPVVYEYSLAGATPLSYQEWVLPLQAGLWSLVVNYTMGTNYGISQLWMDGMSLGTFEEYSATLNSNATYCPSIQLAEGLHTVKYGKTGTKNAASINYFAGLISIGGHKV